MSIPRGSLPPLTWREVMDTLELEEPANGPQCRTALSTILGHSNKSMYIVLAEYHRLLSLPLLMCVFASSCL